MLHLIFGSYIKNKFEQTCVGRLLDKKDYIDHIHSGSKILGHLNNPLHQWFSTTAPGTTRAPQGGC